MNVDPLRLASSPAEGQVQVGLLVEGLVCPNWVHHLVSDMERSGLAEVALVVNRVTLSAPRWWRVRKGLHHGWMVGLLLRHSARMGTDLIDRRLWRLQWLLGYRIDDMDDNWFREGFTPLVPPADRSWADPFPVVFEGRFHIFLEEQFNGAECGHISVIQFDDNGRWSEPVVVLEPKHHVSYPFVFDWEDSLYMIPETCSAGQVELYRCRDFPFRWELDQVLLPGVSAVDPTVVEANGLWWMFANVPERGGARTTNSTCSGPATFAARGVPIQLTRSSPMLGVPDRQAGCCACTVNSTGRRRTAHHATARLSG